MGLQYSGVGTAQDFESYFKPEARSAGAEFLRKGVVRLGMSSDTEVQAFVRVSSGVKVSLRADSIADSVFFADCSCPSAGKGVLCKHIWATILEVSEKAPDFLDSKTEIEKVTRLSEKPQAQKEKQSTFRKEQYQKQKLRANENKRAQAAPKNRSQAPSYPDDVTEALKYFDENGFPLGEPIDPELVKDAKKKMARLMHPDQGGSHEEFLTFNCHLNVVTEFLEFSL